MVEPATMASLKVLALARLLECLAERGYEFTTPTPATHRIVVDRRGPGEATCLRDIFGWNLPFRGAALPPEVRDCMIAAGVLAKADEGLERSRVRVASRGRDLFLHSAFPPAQSSVFFGPDSYRFADFLERQLPAGAPVGTLVDIGAGAGVGAIVAARHCRADRIIMTDVNPTALEYAEANCLRAGVQPVQFIGTRDLDGLEGPFDLIVANPPFIADGGGPTYRDGGDMHGAALSLRWAQAAAARLSVGGRALVYTGSAIVRGEDRLRAALRTAFDSGDLQLDYAEIDPDIFGEQLSAPAYADVERIAAVGFCITRRAAQQS